METPKTYVPRHLPHVAHLPVHPGDNCPCRDCQDDLAYRARCQDCGELHDEDDREFCEQAQFERRSL